MAKHQNALRENSCISCILKKIYPKPLPSETYSELIRVAKILKVFQGNTAKAVKQRETERRDGKFGFIKDLRLR